VETAMSENAKRRASDIPFLETRPRVFAIVNNYSFDPFTHLASLLSRSISVAEAEINLFSEFSGFASLLGTIS
jgi:hypothetical protein